MPKMPVSLQKPLLVSEWAPPTLPITAPAKSQKPDKRALLELLNKGMALQARGKFEEAERFYQQALIVHPNMPEANNLMGTIALEAELFGIAVEYLEKAVVGLPRDPLIRHNLATAFVSQHDYHEAVTHLERALELLPWQFESMVMLADCYNRLGVGQKAMALSETALKREPGDIGARLTYADILISNGKIDEAELLLHEMIASGVDVPRVYQSLASCKKFSADSPELAQVLKLIQSSEKTQEELKPLHFAAAKMSNDAKLYDQSMHHYKLANEVAASKYNVAEYERYVDALIAMFNPLFLGTRKNFGNPSQKPVFIVGMPRSGTTLTEQIISSHPEVSGAGELAEMSAIARSLGDNHYDPTRYQKNLMSMSREKSLELAQRYLNFIGQTSASAARVTDKMPHNYENIGLIALLFPNATIIHCKRDAIDNCVSCYMNGFNEAHDYSCDLHKLGQYYRAYNRLMKHWHKVLPGRIFENRYETLVENLESQARRLITHCRLDWNDACLNYVDNERSVNTISRWQVRQPIYKSSINRWKPYEKPLRPLIEALGDLAET